MALIGKMIKARRIALGMSARDLAQRVGVSDTHIMYIERAQRKGAFDKLLNILTELGLSLDELLGMIGREEMQGTMSGKVKKVPVVSLVAAGGWKDAMDSFPPGVADEWIDSDVAGESVFALRVMGDSMEPEFQHGEIIIINPHIEAQPGDFIIVKNPLGEATFKQLKKFGSGWVLHPLNPKYQDMEVEDGQFQIIGKVVKKEKRY